MQKRNTTVLIAAILFVVFGLSVAAQSGEKYKVRLAPAPPLGIQATAVAGIGSASATLSGRKLAITGSYEKLASAATVARLHSGLLTGARAPVAPPMSELTISNGTDVTITGSVDLTAPQVDALKKGKLYIVVHSEGAPNGHLLGWLLK